MGGLNMMNSRTRGIPVVAKFVVLSALLLVGGLRGRADAECWQSGPYLPGFDGNVRAITRFGTTTYVGGTFTHVNGIEVNGVAQWDGASWSALGTGVGAVYALAVDNGGNLYAGGDFAGKVVKWDGSSWSALGSGLSGGVVLALAADSSGNLYAGGNIRSAGGVQVRALAKWDGASWSGMGVTGDYGYVLALAADASGNLFASTTGQLFSDPGLFWRWDGTRWWIQNGVATNPPVKALAADSAGNVYAAGDYGVAKWEGADYWAELGAGMNVGASALAVDGSGGVYAAGIFAPVGGSPLSNVAKWDGATWSGLGTGTTGSVTALAVGDDGVVYAGGDFMSAGGNPAGNFAEFQPTCPACNNTFGAQNIAIKPRVTVSNVGQAGKERFLITGEFINATAFNLLNPVANGARVIIQNAAGITEADVTAPGGAPNGNPFGWTQSASGKKWSFRGPTRQQENSIALMTIEDRNSQLPNQVRVKIRGARGKYPIVAGDLPIRATVILGGQDASLAGQCGETVFTPGDCSLSGAGTTLRCKQ